MATAKKALPKLTSWSFSRYNDYLTCPYKFKQKHLMRNKEPEPEPKYVDGKLVETPMQRGTRIHKIAEDFVMSTAKGAKMPPELAKLSKQFVMLRKEFNKGTVSVEKDYVFRSDWSQTHAKDWNDAWLRVKIDVERSDGEGVNYQAIDNKTGQLNTYKVAEYMLQLELYAMAIFKGNPAAETAEPLLYFLDHGVVYPPEEETAVYEREQLPDLTKSWMARIKPMFNDTRFDAKANNTCKWCYYRKNNPDYIGPPEGRCKFNG